MQTKFNASSDRQEKFSLQSSLIYFVWNSGAAPLGGEAHLEVGTSFVGDGAPIEITAKTAAGKSVGKITDKIRNNKFVGSMPIPDNLRLGDLVYFKVKLSSHGLEGESNRIPVVLPIIVSDLSWSATEARRGDTLTLKAKVKNVINGTPAKVTIYESDQDGAHDKICELETTVQDEKIELQWEYQYHEDTDEIPSEQELQQYGRSYNPPEYFFTVKLENDEYGRDQSSGLLLFKDWIEIELRDDEGRVVPNQHYKITLPDGTEREGDLDDQGKVRIEDVPPGQFTITYPGAITAVDQEELTENDTEAELSDFELEVADKAKMIMVDPNQLPEGTDQFTTTLKPRLSASSDDRAALRQSLGEGPPNHDAHHIVPCGDSAAEEAQNILKEYGVGINEKVNGVYLPNLAQGADSERGMEPFAATSHQETQSPEYVEAVTARLREAKSEQDVRAILEQIKSELIG